MFLTSVVEFDRFSASELLFKDTFRKTLQNALRSFRKVLDKQSGTILNFPDIFLNLCAGIANMNRSIYLLIIILLLSSLASAATLKGEIYTEYLELAEDVLVEINTVPQQKYLAKTGSYSFELSPGEYLLTAKNNQYVITEEIIVLSEKGEYVLDLFLLPEFTEEDELWQETEEELVVDPEEIPRRLLSWIIVGVIFLALLSRIIYVRKKYGSLHLFRRRIKEESRKTIEQHKEELEKEPSYVEKALEIIKSHGGRITQKELRKELLYLSEAKVSLIVTELEHKELVEKIKKGRGNVLLLKENH